MKRLLLLMLLATPAFGQALRPTVTKSFTPSLIGVNQISTLTITLTNPNNVNLFGASIQDQFPPGLVRAGAAATTCAGGFLGGGPTSLSLQNGTIPANGSCTMTVPVTASSIGLYENSTGALFSSGPSSITFGHATLHVVLPSQIPTLSGWALIILAATLAAAGTMLSRR